MILLQVKDRDIGKKDDTIGSCHLSLTDIKDKRSYSKPFWTHIYGAPSNASNFGERKEVAADMNTYPELGSIESLATSYNGSILIKITLVENPSPVLNVVDIPIQNTNAEVQGRRFTLVVDLASIFNFRSSASETYKMKIIFGPAISKLSDSVVPLD